MMVTTPWLKPIGMILGMVLVQLVLQALVTFGVVIVGGQSIITEEGFRSSNSISFFLAYLLYFSLPCLWFSLAVGIVSVVVVGVVSILNRENILIRNPVILLVAFLSTIAAPIVLFFTWAPYKALYALANWFVCSIALIWLVKRFSLRTRV